MNQQVNAERRRHERQTYQAPVHLRLGHFAPARSLNLSIGGVGILTKQIVEVGSDLEIAFLDMTVSVLGVVRSRAAGDDVHHLGVQFRAEEQEVVEVLLRLQSRFQGR